MLFEIILHKEKSYKKCITFIHINTLHKHYNSAYCFSVRIILKNIECVNILFTDCIFFFENAN